MLSLLTLARWSHDSYRNHRREYDISPHKDKSYLYEENNSGEVHKLNHPRNIEEVDEENAGEASEAVICIQSTGEDGAAPRRAGGSDKQADKSSLKRPAEHELIEGVKPASKIRSDFGKKLPGKQLKKLKANNGEAVGCTGGRNTGGVKKVRFAEELEQGPTGSSFTIESDGTTISTQRVVGGAGTTAMRIGTAVVAEEGSILYPG